MKTSTEKTEKALFAGGCFWCMVPPFERLVGVKSVVCGYTGGTVPNPDYEQVSTGTTGHYEAVEVVYDPASVSYDELLQVFWRQIDPADGAGQFADRGPQYRTAIFYFTHEQKAAAERSRNTLARSGRFGNRIATEILPAGQFYPAEEYHQNYHKKNPGRYELYKKYSGREALQKK